MPCWRCSCALEWRSAAQGLPREALLLASTPEGAQLRFLDFSGAVWQSSGVPEGAGLPFLAAPEANPTGVRACEWPLLCGCKPAGSEKTLLRTATVSLHSCVSTTCFSNPLSLGRRASTQLVCQAYDLAVSAFATRTMYMVHEIRSSVNILDRVALHPADNWPDGCHAEQCTPGCC